MESNPKVARPIRTSSPRLASPLSNPPTERATPGPASPSLSPGSSLFYPHPPPKRDTKTFSRLLIAVAAVTLSLLDTATFHLSTKSVSSPSLETAHSARTQLLLPPHRYTACLLCLPTYQRNKQKDKKALIDPTSLLCVARPTTLRLREINPL